MGLGFRVGSEFMLLLVPLSLLWLPKLLLLLVIQCGLRLGRIGEVRLRLRVSECSAWVFVGLAADMGDMVEGLGAV